MITARVDREGVHAPSGARPWTAFREDGKVRWPLDRPYENFRLLDPLTRFIVIAVEALETEFHPESAIVLASTLGCIGTDRRFEASRHDVLHPALFPYTLASSPMAAVAIRHRITGPGLCLSVAPDDRTSPFEEAQRLIRGGEAPAAIVCIGDVVPPDTMWMEATHLTT